MAGFHRSKNFIFNSACSYSDVLTVLVIADTDNNTVRDTDEQFWTNS